MFKVLSSLQRIDQKKEELNTSPVLNDESNLKQASPLEDSTNTTKVDLFSLLNSDKKPDLASFLTTSIHKTQEPPR